MGLGRLVKKKKNRLKQLFVMGNFQNLIVKMTLLDNWYILFSNLIFSKIWTAPIVRNLYIIFSSIDF